ncbi:MAG: transporter substrate-binding domain-containing protein, partial [Deltaproteobacteria bacterium]|nr:transporter substrate-binding domain-containing protein [Deltaproteobacteria bacterium]
EIDLLPMMAYSKERDKVFDFSAPHTVAFDAFFTRKDSKRINAIEDLKGQTVIVMKGDQAHDYLRSSGFVDSEHLILIDSLPEALRLLSSGKGDAALMPKLVGLSVMTDLNLTNLTQSPVVVESYNRPFSFAVKDGNQLLLERLNQGLSIVNKTGQYREIYDKWFGALEPKELSLKSVLKYIVGMLLALILIGSAFALWSFSLRKQVVLRTKKLSDEIVERKLAEEALRNSETTLNLLLETIPIPVFYKDREGRYLGFNNAFEVCFGKSKEELIGKSVFDISPPELAEVYHAKDVELFEKPGVQVYDSQVRDAHGALRDVIFHKASLTDAQGLVTGLIGAILDITERKKMEEELLRAQKLESVGVLAGGIAHDFNNILTTILGNVSMAKTQVKSEDEIFDLLNEAETASIRAQALTKQLLTFAKGGSPLKESASIKDILKESFSFMLRGSKSGCEFSIAEDLWSAEVDVGQISQVINNVVINANQAMPKGGIIQVAAVNLIIDDGYGLPLKPGRYIRISVIDQGVGIAQKHLLNIFDPYFTTKQEGSGLGLATTYSIIKKHDGHITVESQLGGGTIFHIYLPASDKAVPEKEVDRLIKGQGRILVMDDEAPLRKMVGVMLKNFGYESEFAKDGAEAIQMCKAAKEAEKPFDAVILDLTVPGGMGGKETIHKLLEIDPEVKAIVSSGYSDDPVLSNFQEYGFKGMMPKPFTSHSLSKVLHEVLQSEKE